MYHKNHLAILGSCSVQFQRWVDIRIKSSAYKRWDSGRSSIFTGSPSHRIYFSCGIVNKTFSNIYFNNKQTITNDSVRKDDVVDFKLRNCLP